MTRAPFTAILGWTLLVLLLVSYGAGGRYSPYAVLALMPVLLVHIVYVRAGRPLVPNGATIGFLAAFGLLTLAFSLAAEQPSDVLIMANFVWLPLIGPLQAELKRIAWPGAAVAIARLALLGVVVTLISGIYERATYGTSRVGYITSDAIRIANTAVILGFLALMGIISDRGWRRAVYLLGPILAMVVALLAGTRGAMASTCVLAVVATIFLVPNRRRAVAIAVGLGVFLIGALLIGAQLHVPRVEALVRTIEQLLTGQQVTDGSAAIRIAMLQAGWGAFLESPLFGHGWQRLMTAVVPYLPPGQENMLHGQPHLHNDVADFAVSAGLLGLAAYALLLVTPLVAAIRSTRDSLYRARLFGVVMLVTAYAALGLNSIMFGFEVHTSLYCGLCAVLLGFCRETSSMAAETASPVVSRKPAGRVEHGLAWLIAALSLATVTVFGLVSPYVILVIALLYWFALLFSGRLPETYSALAGKLMLVAFAVLAVVFTITMKGWRDPLFAFNFTALLLFGPLLALFARTTSERLRAGVVLMATIGVAATLGMVIYTAAASSGRPTGINIGPIVLSNAALALAVVATTGALAYRNALSLALPLTLAAAIAVVFLTLSRGPLIAIVPLLLFTAVMLWRVRLRIHWGLAAGIAAILITVIALAVANSPARISSLPVRLWSMVTGGGLADHTGDIRLGLYRAGWQAFLEAPWFGHGWARLMKAVIPYVEPQFLEDAQRLPQLHNDVVNFAVAGGVVGVATYVLIVLAPLIAAVRSPPDGYRAARIYGTGGLLIVYASAGLTDLMFGHEFHTALFVLLNAIVLGAFRETPKALSPASRS